MNGQKAKQLRRIGEQRLIDWLRTMVPAGEDTSKINKNNLHEFLPTQTHIFANGKFFISAYTLRWFYKQVKKNPDFKV